MERYLEKNHTLRMNDGGRYVIGEMIGTGSSCAVYRAEHFTADGVQTEHLLKEYNPRAVNVTRGTDGSMLILPDERDDFDNGMVRFKNGYEKQLCVRRMSGLRNSTSNVQTVFDANGTRYIDMTLFTGDTYSQIREKSLYDLCRRMKAVTQVIGNYHKAGLLHLDIKPDNIFAIPETSELVMLFDFDSVVEKSSIGQKTGLSYTKTWAAPEQIIAAYRTKICEATDLYAIGEMIFWQVFGRHSTSEEHRSFFEYRFDTEADLFKNTDPKVFPRLSELLHHTIATSVGNRYQSADDLITALDELIRLSDPKEPYLVSSKVNAEEFFIGRDTELKTIQENLSENSVLFLCGMGGIGKSELARNYVKRYRGSYDTVFFATYMSGWSMLLRDDFSIQIANFRPYEGEKPEDYFARKIRKLKELCNKRTLFVVDNVNEDEFSEAETECYKQIMALPCRFLFTSRLHDWSYPMLPIGTLEDRSDLMKLFDKWCKIKDGEQKTAVEEIIEYVDAHTLTLELIAKQTTAAFSTPAKMLEKLKKYGMHSSGKETVKSDKDRTVTKKTPFEHICDLFDMVELSDGEKFVMANMALMPTTGIEAQLFMEWCELEDAEDIGSLVAKGWIDRNEESIRLHPIIAEVARSYRYDFDLADTVMLKNARDYLTDNYLSFSVGKKAYYADFAMSMANVLIISGLCSDAVGVFLSDVTDKYHLHKSLDEAISIQQYALKLFRDIHGEDHPAIAISLNNIGEINTEKGNYDTALQYHEQALAIRKKIFGDEHQDVAESLNDIGVVYYDKGDLGIALKYYEQAFNIQRKLLGEDHPAIAVSHNNIGVVYHDKGDLDIALKYYEQAFNIQRKLLGEDHPAIAVSLNNIGEINVEKGNYDAALQYHEQALSIRKKTFGNNHPDVAISLSNIGAIYDDKGDYDTALQYHEQALSIRKKTFGNNHPDVAISLNNFGIFYYSKGDFDTALQYHEQALTIRRKIYGDNHPEIARSLIHIGEAYNGKGDLDKALQYYEQALSIRKKTFGNDHPDTLQLMSMINSIKKQS